MKWSIVLLSVLITAMFILGCSGGSDPVQPSDSQDLTGQSSEQSSGKALWGLWHCYAEPGSSNIEIVPLRTATFTANVNKILEGKPGNLQIKDMDVSDLFTHGWLNCTVELHHPFPGLGMYNGFDVWGVFMHNGTASLQYDGLTYADGTVGDEALLLNPDGYTRWFNATEFDGNGIPLIEYWPGKLGKIPLPTAMLNPYKVFADGLEADDDYYQWLQNPGNTQDRGIFKAGNVNGRRYELKFPVYGGNPVVDFQYAAVASWEPGNPALTGDAGTYDPFDFPSSANCEEPFFVNVSTIASDIYYAASDDYGGTFRADVEVFDWQGGSVGNTGVPNEIESIIFEGNFISGGSYEFSQADLAPLAQPATVNSSVFSVEIAGCSPQSNGDVNFWVIVESAGLNGASYGQGFPTEYPEDARRAYFKQSSVFITDQLQNVPCDYNLVLTVERNSTNLITGIMLDWDDCDGTTGFNVYRQDPFDTGDDWELVPASPVTVSEYLDTDIVGNEAYQYRVIGVVGASEVDDVSVEAYAILENAEDNVNTHSVWETCAFPIMYNPSWLPNSLFNEFAPLDLTPQNGTYCWDEGGIQNSGAGNPGTYWTGSATLFATPVLPIPDDSSVCLADFCIRLNNMWPNWTGDQCGTVVGVTDYVQDGPNNPFIPSQDYIEGLDYNLPHIHGLSNYGNYTNITTANDMGHGTQYPAYQVIEWTRSEFAVPDVFTIQNSRVAFAWGCGNSAGGTAITNAGTSFDDIAILIY
ncbi:MAG: hypothetical protein ABIC40_08830 [bacterium]